MTVNIGYLFLLLIFLKDKYAIFFRLAMLKVIVYWSNGKMSLDCTTKKKKKSKIYLRVIQE